MNMGFAHTSRKVTSVVLILIAIVLALSGLGKLYEYVMFLDTWYLSQTIAYGLFVAVFGGVGWVIHPPDQD
jgi:hypothetical protein